MRVLIVAVILLGAACSPSATASIAPSATAASASPTATPSTAPPAASEPSHRTSPTGQPTATSGAASPTFRGGAWTRLGNAPAALTEVAAAAHQGKIWVAGGLRVDGSAADVVVVFDPVAGTWAEGPKLPEGIHHSALVSTGDGLYLLGGYRSGLPGSPTAAVRRLDQPAGRWADGPALPEPRGAGTAAWDGARIVFAGGVSSSGVARQVWALEAGSWRLIGPLARAREHLAATSDGQGRVWLLGGRAQSLDANVGTIEVVDGDQVRAGGGPMTPRSGVAAFWNPAIGACLAGGEGPAGTHAEVECVNAAGAVTALPRLAVARHGLGAAVVDGAVFVLLGGERPGLFVSPIVEVLALPKA